MTITSNPSAALSNSLEALGLRVVDELRMRGFANTAVLDEGIVFWQDAGYPMARGRLP